MCVEHVPSKFRNVVNLLLANEPIHIFYRPIHAPATHVHLQSLTRVGLDHQTINTIHFVDMYPNPENKRKEKMHKYADSQSIFGYSFLPFSLVHCDQLTVFSYSTPPIPVHSPIARRIS